MRRKRMEPQTAEFKFEKHVPYPEASGTGMKVSVGPEWRVCMDWAECSGTDCVFKVKNQ